MSELRPRERPTEARRCCQRQPAGHRVRVGGSFGRLRTPGWRRRPPQMRPRRQPRASPRAATPPGLEPSRGVEAAAGPVYPPDARVLRLAAHRRLPATRRAVGSRFSLPSLTAPGYGDGERDSPHHLLIRSVGNIAPGRSRPEARGPESRRGAPDRVRRLLCRAMRSCPGWPHSGRLLLADEDSYRGSEGQHVGLGPLWTPLTPIPAKG